MNKLSLSRLDRIYNNDFFLGRWCLDSDEQYHEELVNNQVVPYILGNKEFHKTAKIKTDECYSNILPLVVKVLNKKSNNNYPIRFWEIIIGSWLRQYLDVLYERYATLINANKYLGKEVRVFLINEKNETIAFNSDEFSCELFSDKLNHQIYGQIIRARNIWGYSNELDPDKENLKIGRRKRNTLLIYIAEKLSQIISYKGEILVSNSNLDFKVLFTGFFKGIWRPIYCQKYQNNGIEVDKLGRKSDFAIDNTEINNDFDELALELIQSNLPIIFYEQLNDLLETAKKTLPINLKVFITANPNAAGELAKTWVAFQSNNNKCKYLIMQHGSNYGQSDVITDEDVELAVCDKFLSSGWLDKKNEKIDNSNAVARLSGIGDFRNNKPPKKTNNKILLILASLPRYYYTGWSAPQGPIFANYLTSLASLSRYISIDVKTRILCRPYNYDYGWNDQYYLEKNGFDFLSGRRRGLVGLMKKNALNIFTYNSTAVLEAFANNYISCCYWDPNQWAWRKEAQDDLAMLEQVGIYHRSIESLARFINKHKTNESLILWWSSNDVQLARNSFCEKYAKTNSNEIKYWSELLN